MKEDTFLTDPSRPLLILMTPVRDEAWVLPAYLEVASQWADAIVIADQNSGDGSREIMAGFPKVHVISNDCDDFNERDRWEMLIGKAREIAGGRDAILFGLDADEVFDSRFAGTEDWQRILRSKPGDVFKFQWNVITPDKLRSWDYNYWYAWCFHDDGITEFRNGVSYMHTTRIPYPDNEENVYEVHDFKVLHLAYLNRNRDRQKHRYYRFIEWEKDKMKPVWFGRTVDAIYGFSTSPFDHELAVYPDGADIFDLVDTEFSEFYYDHYIAARLKNHPEEQIRKLPIWEKDFLARTGLSDPRRPVDKMIHRYLRHTSRKHRMIRWIDRVLNLFY